MLSDAHERRLGEAADGLAELAGGTAPRSIVCDVTDEAQVQAMIDAHRSRPTAGSTCSSTTPGSAARPSWST